MQFIITNKAANKHWMAGRVLIDARTVLLFYRLKPSEYKLNQYLKDNYNMGLISSCMHLVMHCKHYHDLDNNIIILFPREEDDKLASLITYGNAEVPGSNILKEVFFRKD